MEPLDHKAELMRLARECGDIERRHCIGKAQGFDVRDAYIALESAITLALAAERRQSEDRLQIALGALADIAISGDMTLKMARHEANRIYEQLVDGKANE